LVITELKLGGMDGFEIIAEMRRELVCARFIGTARPGWLPADHNSRMAEHPGVHGVLMKPFSPLQFLSAVRGALGETDGQPHSFIPAIVVASSRHPVPAAMEATGTFRTTIPSGNCTRISRRWRRGMRRIS
jgi:DNA-binding response OmpR family regulator